MNQQTAGTTVTPEPAAPSVAVPGQSTPDVNRLPGAQEAQDAFDTVDDDIVESMRSTSAEPAEPAPGEPQQPAAPSQPATPQAQPQQTQVPAVPPVQVPAQPAPATSGDQPVVQPQVQQPQPQQPAPQPAPAQIFQPETPEARAAREASERTAYESMITQTAERYKLSDDDAKALLLEPEKVMPRLAATLYHNVMRDIQTQVLPQVVPAILQSHQQMAERDRQATDAFYTPWAGKLDRNNPEHDKVVRNIGVMWRQLNPTASPEEAITNIGRLACASLGLQVDGTVQPPVAPAAPFRPAVGGGAPIALPDPQSQGNAYSDLAGERGS